MVQKWVRWLMAPNSKPPKKKAPRTSWVSVANSVI